MRSVVIASLVLAPALALAQPKTADEWYTEGETQYNLGNFDKAADAFKQGFAAEPDESKKPAYLYNVAQAYRQGNRCKDAAFFYKRYLVLKDRDADKPLKPEKRTEIEGRIAELEECASKQQPTTTRPTTTTTKPTTTTTTTGPTTTRPTTTTTKPTTTTTTTTKPTTTRPTTVAQGNQEDEGEAVEEEEEDDGEGVSETAGFTPQLVSARAELGATTIFAGDVDMGTRAVFALLGGYPVFKQDKLLVEAGGLFSFVAVPYTNFMTQASGTASMINLMANGAATYEVMPKIHARGDLGVGILTFAGLGSAGNPFTEGGVPTTGALTMFALRVAASADYEITPNIIGTVTPIALSLSPAKSGLRNDMFTRLEFMVGVGYRM